MPNTPKYREASVTDIRELHNVRMSVKENVLRNQLQVTENDYITYLALRGKGWLCEVGNKVIGFAIVDTDRNNVWALFVRPEFEKKGIGKQLQQIMLDWFFTQTEKKLSLGTSPNTRAEKFYVLSGWKETGMKDNGEIRFEMTYDQWKLKKNRK